MVVLLMLPKKSKNDTRAKRSRPKGEMGQDEFKLGDGKSKILKKLILKRTI